MLFSYVLLCDYHPLYEYQSGQCSSGDGERNLSDISADNMQNKSISHSTTDGHPLKGNHRQLERGPSIAEIVLMVWVFTLFCEEMRQVGTLRMALGQL